MCVCVCLCVCTCLRACVFSRKPWPVRVRVRVTQGLSLFNSPGVIETNGLSSLILLGQYYRGSRGDRLANRLAPGAGRRIHVWSKHRYPIWEFSLSAPRNIWSTFFRIFFVLSRHRSAPAVYYSTWVNTGGISSAQCSAHVFQRRPAQASARVPSPLDSGPITGRSPLPAIWEQVQEFVFLIRILRDQLLLMDSFSSGQCQSVSVCFLQSPTEMPENWAHGLTFKLLKSEQAKFPAYFHVIVMHINTCMRFLPGRHADGLSLLTNTRDFKYFIPLSYLLFNKA